MILNVEIAERNDIMGKVMTRYIITNEYRQEMARTTLGIVVQAEIDDAMKLIAAGPDLLAESQNLLAWWNLLPLDSKPTLPNHDAILAVIASVRTIVRKIDEA